ncbi:hypothetical protein [Microcystis aeruginosa]|uniref:hypothetical protein n=1 Tax=Microcystis aeruginosa TaxID=1126 RepID=UPI0034D2FB79
MFLRLKGYEITGFDPFFFPLNPLRKSDVVTLNYVINVIEDPIERASVLKIAYELARKRLICAIRTDPAPSVVLPTATGISYPRDAFKSTIHKNQQRIF